jgi:hypothetical protein
MDEPKKIDVNGFMVPASYHDALQILIDGLRYGEYGYGMPRVVRGFVDKLDRSSPAGFLLTEKQVDLYVNCEMPFMVQGELNFMTMYGMGVEDMVEIQTWYNHLQNQYGVGTNPDWQAARLEMMEFLEGLRDLRVNYDNPGLGYVVVATS